MFGLPLVVEMTHAAICLPTIGTSSLRPLLRVTPPPLTSVEANSMTGIPAAFSCLTSDAYATTVLNYAKGYSSFSIAPQ